MACSVETVAADVVLFIQFNRNGVHVGMLGHGLMEGCVKNGDLMCMWQQFFYGIYTQQVGRVVQWGEPGKFPDVIFYPFVNLDTFLVIFATLSHAVSYSLDLGQ